MNDCKVIRGDWKRRRIDKSDQMVFMADPEGPYVQLVMPNGSEHVIALEEADLLMGELRAQVPPLLRYRPQIGMNSGRMFDYINPDNCPVVIEDVAHALAQIPRFTGHLDTPGYSVAQHSVLCAWNTKGDPYDALMHDAHESVVNDLSTPYKQLLNDYSYQEKRAAEYFTERFKFVPAWQSAAVKEIDAVLLATEVRDLFTQARSIYPELWAFLDTTEPLTERIEPWGFEEAKAQFLQTYERLRPDNAPAVRR